MTPLPSRPSTSMTWVQRSLIFLAFGVVLAFQIWTVRTSIGGWPRVKHNENDYYNLLSRGFLSGRLSLKTQPDPALLKLSDPYDPAQRVGVPVFHDASLYHNRYYLYWGPAPVVALFLPFRVLVGDDLPQIYGNLIFVIVGFLALAHLWLRVRSDYFPKSRMSVAVVGILALGACGMTLSLVRRPSLWELPIASGYAFAMIGLASVYEGLRANAIKRWWVLASLAFGMAIASRPTYGVGIGPLMLVLAWGRLRIAWQSAGRKSWPPGSWWGEILALGLPVTAAVIGLLGYNYARFDHAFEFGLKYQLSGTNEITATHFSPRYAGLNAYLYYFAPAQWGRYFPFVQLIHSRFLQPVGYYGMEYCYGLLVNEPLTLLALLAPLACWRRTAEEQNILLPFLFAITAFFVGIGAVLLCFWAGTQRYMADFAPVLVLLGCVGLLSSERWLQSIPSRFASVGRWLGLGAALFSVFFGIFISFQLHGMFKYFSPRTYQRLARALNSPAYCMEKWGNFSHGPLEMDLRFPKGRTGKLEPLLSTGWEFFSDQVFVYYMDDRHLRLGFDHVSRGTRMTVPLKIDFDAVHHLRLELGSLYPPEESPFFDDKSDTERASLTRWLRVILDGQIVLDSPQLFYDASPESIQIGGTTATQAFGERFTGEIVHLKRGPHKSVGDPPGIYGPMMMKLSFPSDLDNRIQPLVGTGVGGRSDSLYVQYVRNGSIRFGYDHSGGGAWQSDEIAVTPNFAHELEIYMPSLLVSEHEAAYSSLSRNVAIILDQRLVWSAEVPSYRVHPSSISVGRNSTGLGGCETDFTGVISIVKRDPQIGAPTPPHTDQVELRMVFLKNHLGRREPLFVRGPTGAADILLVHYIDGSHIRFALEHWGVGIVESDPLEVDFRAVHTVNLRLGPLLPKTAEAKNRHFTLTLDGKAVWSGETAFYPATADKVSVGVNSIGASTCDAEFSGLLLRVSYPSDTDLH